MEVLDKFKIHLKSEAMTNIPLCWMVTMPIVHLAFKIDVMKMEQAFQMGYKEGERVFYITTNKERLSLWPKFQSPKVHLGSKIMKILRNSWRWMQTCHLCVKKIFHVWDDNHRFQTWFPYINSVHLNDMEWHFLWILMCSTQLVCLIPMSIEIFISFPLLRTTWRQGHPPLWYNNLRLDVALNLIEVQSLAKYIKH